MAAENGVCEYRNSVSSSLVNVFDNDGTSRRKTVESVITVVDELSINNMSTCDNSNSSLVDDTSFDNFDPKMSRDEYLESIFGPRSRGFNERKTWRQKIRYFLTSNYLNVIVVLLVLLDSICVTIELIIDLENTKQGDALRIAAAFFKYLGFTIISIFVVEITLKVVFLWREFFKSKMEVIDGIIVYVSFALDILFMHNEEIFALVGLIALFRFWRIIRIVNGVIVSIERRADAKIEKLKHGMNALIKETDTLKVQLHKKQALLDDIFVAYSI